MKIFQTDLRSQIVALESAQLGMCRLSFSESKLPVHLWKSGSLHNAQHPKKKKPHQRHTKPFFTFKGFYSDNQDRGGLNFG